MIKVKAYHCHPNVTEIYWLTYGCQKGRCDGKELHSLEPDRATVVDLGRKNYELRNVLRR